MRLTHKEKLKIAHKHGQKYKGVMIFHSDFWQNRKFNIMQRVKRQEARAKYGASIRKQKELA